MPKSPFAPSESVSTHSSAQESKKAFGAKAVLRYMQGVLAKGYRPDEKQEKELRALFANRPPRARADIVYEKLMAYAADKNQAREDEMPVEPDEKLMRAIKVLMEDADTQRIFSETFAEARLEAKDHKRSVLGKEWEGNNASLASVEEELKKVERRLFLKLEKGKSKQSNMRTEVERLTAELLRLQSERDGLRSLNGKELSPENTDAAAQFNFNTFVKYANQLQKGFVWLPSREKIHRDLLNQLQDGRWPMLVGEAGTGKSQQANAAALELTGSLPTEIECEKNTDSTTLIGDVRVEGGSGETYTEYGPLMSAFTGYDDSRQTKPTHESGRIARLDESGRLGPRGYAAIKAARQKKPGDLFHGHPVLPGAATIWTTNPVSARYTERQQVDVAMRRELAKIEIPYFDQSPESPETFEFMVAALMDENRHLQVAEEELAPAYKKEEFTDDAMIPLSDGRIPVAEDKLILDPTSPEHGTLWRLANAVKTVQNAFSYANARLEQIPDDALRFTESADNEIILGETNGEPLQLSTSTISAFNLQSWMTGYNERMQKKDADYRVGTFAEWIAFKLKSYVQQAEHDDQKKLEAIFNYYHLLEPTVDVSHARPITPKRIGYLSPRVPRPLHLQPAPVKSEVIPSDVPSGEEQPTLEAREILTKQVTLEDGSTVMITLEGYSEILPDQDDGTASWDIALNRHFRVQNEDFQFAGIVQQPGHPKNGKLVGRPDNGEELYRIFDPEQANRGMFVYDTDKLLEDINVSIKNIMMVSWQSTCENNDVNNPEKIPAPAW